MNITEKTLGSLSARLVTGLYDKRRIVFSHRDAQEITGRAAKSTRNLVAGMVRRGIATRLKGGLFILVPFELGREREYLGNPYVVAGELAGGRDHYLSHASAMDLHGMVTQPQLVVFVTTPRAIRPRTILGTEFRFVRCKPDHLFGVVEHWVDKTQKVLASDPERTIIDGLKQPEYCGGFTEVAKAFWMRRDGLKIDRLVDYALRLGVGAVVRRLGFLLETCGVDALAEVERLRSQLTDTYQILDPTLPAEGRSLARWRIRMNVSRDEILAVAAT